MANPLECCCFVVPFKVIINPTDGAINSHSCTALLQCRSSILSIYHYIFCRPFSSSWHNWLHHKKNLNKPPPPPFKGLKIKSDNNNNFQEKGGRKKKIKLYSLFLLLAWMQRANVGAYIVFGYRVHMSFCELLAWWIHEITTTRHSAASAENAEKNGVRELNPKRKFSGLLNPLGKLALDDVYLSYATRRRGGGRGRDCSCMTTKRCTETHSTTATAIAIAYSYIQFD